MSNYILEHCGRRYNRKLRQWGLHGRHADDNLSREMNRFFRTIYGHYYYGRGEHADRKWRKLHEKEMARRMEVTG